MSYTDLRSPRVDRILTKYIDKIMREVGHEDATIVVIMAPGTARGAPTVMTNTDEARALAAIKELPVTSDGEPRIRRMGLVY